MTLEITATFTGQIIRVIEVMMQSRVKSLVFDPVLGPSVTCSYFDLPSYVYVWLD